MYQPATRSLVSGGGPSVPALLEEWGFVAEVWRHWRANPQLTNPGLREWPTIPRPSGPKPKQGYDR